MNLNETFNASELPESTGFDPVPAGEYTARITEAELKNTNAGTGQYIKVRFDIIGPSHAGRVVFTNLNIRNPNPKAEEIGRQQLGEIMRAIGLASVTDTDQLIGGTCKIRVTVKNDEQYGPGNEVKGFKAAGAGTPPPAGQPVPAAQTQPASAAPAGAPPWASK